MFPLMDVVFLLLCFFIYSQLVTPDTRGLPLDLAVQKTGEGGIESLPLVITIDPNGDLLHNGEIATEAELRQALVDHMASADGGTVFLAMDERRVAGVDRGPVWVRVVGICHELGVTDLTIVGEAGP